MVDSTELILMTIAAIGIAGVLYVIYRLMYPSWGNRRFDWR